jgi:hypothetical protein
MQLLAVSPGVLFFDTGQEGLTKRKEGNSDVDKGPGSCAEAGRRVKGVQSTLTTTTNQCMASWQRSRIQVTWLQSFWQTSFVRIPF